MASEEGTCGMTIDPEVSFSWYDYMHLISLFHCLLIKTYDRYMKSSQRGNAHAQVYLARIYREGFGVERDTNESAKWLTLATQSGSVGAFYELGSLITHSSTTQWDPYSYQLCICICDGK
jgi:hypothetical protein